MNGRNMGGEEDTDNTPGATRLNKLYESIRNIFNDVDQTGKKIEVKNQ